MEPGLHILQWCSPGSISLVCCKSYSTLSTSDKQQKITSNCTDSTFTPTCSPVMRLAAYQAQNWPDSCSSPESLICRLRDGRSHQCSQGKYHLSDSDCCCYCQHSPSERLRLRGAVGAHRVAWRCLHYKMRLVSCHLGSSVKLHSFTNRTCLYRRLHLDGHIQRECLIECIPVAGLLTSTVHGIT